MIKIIEYSILFLVIGFSCGYITRMMTASKPSEIVTKTQTIDSSKQFQQVQTQADTKKDSNKEKIEFIEHKTYSNKGKLK